MKINIIGSGIAGLTAALTLARDGHTVQVFEQYHRIGGVTGGMEAEGFEWDYGQLVVEAFGENEYIGKLLKELGVFDKLNLVLDEREYVFPDFTIRVPEEYQGFQWRIDFLKKQFPEEAAGLDAYWKDYVRFTRLVTLGGRLEKEGIATRIAFYLALLPFLPKMKWSAEKLLAHYFHSEKLKCVFMSILADFFTPPSQFPGMGIFTLNGEVTFEKRMPVELAKNAVMTRYYSIGGGLKTLMRAMADGIEACNGKIHTNCAIEKIVVKDGKACGVVDQNGKVYDCDVVIASGGAKKTFTRLLPAGSLPADYLDKVQSIPLMGSVFMIHLGVDYDPSDVLHTVCTYFYGSYDIEAEVKRAQAGLYHEGEAGFVVHFPSLRSPGMAPKGMHSLTIYTICPDRLANGDWESEKEKYADKLLEYAEKKLPGLREHIVVKRILSPVELRQLTHLDHHAFGGTAPVMNAWKIPHQTPIDGLWFIGAQSESGGGVNNVLPSAYKTAKKIASKI
ncbi:MAG TPA: NAD(P)/FAD-dependent oxidoreductase [Anaerolineaceae bacterium]|nr:NAD(P)/FAD-dependent oxidoreductase [Anaerolineaceae bacterium]